MQKKVLLSSILVIALCLSVIAGSTYALFTDKAQTSIVITAGEVEVSASLDIANVYSAIPHGTLVDEYLKDEYGQYYNHEEQTNTGVVDGFEVRYFSNGGYAFIDDESKLQIVNMTPGDRVDVQITVENTGDVDMVYRLKLYANGELQNAMIVTTYDTTSGVVKESAHGGLQSHTSAWSDIVTWDGNDTRTIDLSFELPVYVGNDYEGETITYDIVVEAVQGNANTNGIDAVPAN